MCACRIISSSRLRHKTALDWRNMLGNSAPQTSSHIHVSDRIGGASRDRTDGLVVANDALSQLSYSPTCRNQQCNFSSVPSQDQDHDQAAAGGPRPPTIVFTSRLFQRLMERPRGFVLHVYVAPTR